MARITILLSGFVLVTVNAQTIGANGVGSVSLIMLAITVFLVINEPVGGGAVVYVAARANTANIIFISYLYSFVMVLPYIWVLKLMNYINSDYMFDIAVLSVLQAFSIVNMNILTSKKKIGLYSLLLFLNTGGLLFFVLLFYFVLYSPAVEYFIRAMYYTYSIVAIMGFLLIGKEFSGFNLYELPNTFKSLFSLGGWSFLSNFFQKITYRLNYYLLSVFAGVAQTGLFSVATQITESTWIISKSIGTTQYAQISNSKDKSYGQNLTVLLIKMIVPIMIFVLAILLLIPSQIYVFVFGDEFSDVKKIVLFLLPGTFFLSISIILSNFFAGNGLIKVNALVSVVSFLVVVIFSVILIPEYSFYGSAIAVSAAYLVGFIIHLLFFVKKAKLKSGDFKITKKDLEKIRLYLH